MSTTTIVVIVAVVVVVILLGLVALMAGQAQKRDKLRQRFGPEYDRTVDVAGSPKQAELDLRARAERRDRLSIVPLSPARRDRYEQDWRQVQAAFVDAPGAALGRADVLIGAVMVERGYPMEDFDDQAELISVDHPRVVEHYRQAHKIYVASQMAPVPTEDMRQAFVHYRSLFSELVGDVTPVGPEGYGPSDPRARPTNS